MMKFRKKPVIIEAECNTLRNRENVIKLLESCERDSHFDKDLVIINTLEGNMIANIGDWIIKGIKGECYPCKPDIFEETYEKVEE